jgi:hypothetical protein
VCVYYIALWVISGKLYKWTADGYQRGLIVKVDNANDNAAAQKYMASRTWSWRLLKTDEVKKSESEELAETIRIIKKAITRYNTTLQILSK